MSPANWNVPESLFRRSLPKSLYPDGLAQSQVLHRLAILEILWVVRQQGSTLTLAGNGEECWKLTRPLSQHAALIEAACFGATLQKPHAIN